MRPSGPPVVTLRWQKSDIFSGMTASLDGRGGVWQRHDDAQGMEIRDSTVGYRERGPFGRGFLVWNTACNPPCTGRHIKNSDTYTPKTGNLPPNAAIFLSHRRCLLQQESCSDGRKGIGASTVGMYTPSVIQMASLGLLGPQGTEVSRLAQHLPRRLRTVARGTNRSQLGSAAQATR